MTVKEFIEVSTDNIAFIIAKQGDLLAKNPIYRCYTLLEYAAMPEKIENLKISRYVFDKVENNIAYVIVNTYEEEEHDTKNQES